MGLVDLREEADLDQETGNNNPCFGHCLVPMVSMVLRLFDIRFLLQSLKEQLHSALAWDKGTTKQALKLKLISFLSGKEIFLTDVTVTL